MEMTELKGKVTHIDQNGVYLQIWISSPTGDASDSHIYTLVCSNETQAKEIQKMWCDVWGLSAPSED